MNKKTTPCIFTFNERLKMGSRYAAHWLSVCMAVLCVLNGNGQPVSEPQPSSTTVTLKIGDPAPAISTGKWIQGEPITQFEKGKAYLIEFWATWCAPCIEIIPHLNTIHEKYKDKDLVVIGQYVSNKDTEKVAPFVAKMGTQMAYRIALDNFSEFERGAMAQNWGDASGQKSIPTVFLVGKDGKIAWIGHPYGLLLNESIIDGVLEGTFDGIKVYAGPMGQTKRLDVGDPALPLNVGKWLKGEPVSKLEKGKAYLIDFWATWCAPCIEIIPHLNTIHEKYKDKDLVVIGIDIGEPAAKYFKQKISPESVAEKMMYRVAMDDIAGSKTGGGRMSETWMVQAEFKAVPAAILVGKDGLIKYIGDPRSLSNDVIESAINP
jgi:thiol-disulfide isomerase/thioredoxin